jgi:hypothetical protein
MAKRRTRKSAPRGQRQKDGAPPIIEDAHLPRMGEAPPADTKSRAVMPESPEPDTGKRNRMRPLRKAAAAAAGQPPARGFRDQEPPRRSRSSKDDGSGGDGYLRLRVLVEPGKLSLVGGTVVEGPLAQAAELHPGLAYEVTLGSRRVAVGQVQDAGVWRSFGDPSGRPALSGHHITLLPSYEIAVRVPLTGLSMAALRRANLTVYRWRGDAADTQGERSVKARLGKRVETIGRLKGIRIDSLPKAAGARLKAALTRRS